MRITRNHSTMNPLLRWKWYAAGVFGYSMTKRGACAAARRQIEQARRS